MTIKDAILAVIGAEGRAGLWGRTLLQKKLYFTSVLTGENFRFRSHFYGPYSSSVADDLGALVGSGLVAEKVHVLAEGVDRVGDVRRYGYTLHPDLAKLLSRKGDALAPYLNVLQAVNAHAISKDPFLISVAAKVHFIVADSGSASVAEIKSRAQDLGWNLTDDQIVKVVGYLEHLKLVRKT